MIPVDLSRTAWRKSSHSQPLGEDCVELAPVADHIAVRDSKDPSGGTLVFDRRQWRSFITRIKRDGLAP